VSRRSPRQKPVGLSQATALTIKSKSVAISNSYPNLSTLNSPPKAALGGRRISLFNPKLSWNFLNPTPATDPTFCRPNRDPLTSFSSHPTAGFMKIRYYGFMNPNCAVSLDRIRGLIEISYGFTVALPKSNYVAPDAPIAGSRSRNNTEHNQKLPLHIHCTPCHAAKLTFNPRRNSTRRTFTLILIATALIRAS
jgi:hypothetical protein